MLNNKLKIKKGDTVKILSGKDKGKTGKVLKAIPVDLKVVVENVNLRTKFKKSAKANEPGVKISFEAPLHSSKVMLVDSSSGKPTRVGFSTLENGTKQRISKKSGKAV
jgi:large subunit ribosomal protein L24